MNRLRSIVSWLILVILICIVGAIANTIFFKPIPSIYNISARSEVVEFITLDDNLSRYIVYGATIMNDEGILENHFDGSIQIKAGTEVTIKRLGKGDINITLKHINGQSVGNLYTGLGQHILPYQESILDIYIDSIENKLGQGKHHHFNIEGETKIGKNIYHLNFLESPAMLQSGQISILGRSYWGKDYFEAGTRELHAGDRVVFDLDPKYENAEDTLNAKGVGFVRIDDITAMNLSYRRMANNVSIFKPGPKTETSSYSISVSLVERFINDKLFWGLSLLLAFCLILINILTFIYDTHFFLKEKKNNQNQKIEAQKKKKKALNKKGGK